MYLKVEDYSFATIISTRERGNFNWVQVLKKSKKLDEVNLFVFNELKKQWKQTTQVFFSSTLKFIIYYGRRHNIYLISLGSSYDEVEVVIFSLRKQTLSQLKLESFYSYNF